MLHRGGFAIKGLCVGLIKEASRKFCWWETWRTKYSVFHVRVIGPIQCHWLGCVGLKMKTTIWYINIQTQPSSGILNIPIFMHKNAFYRKRQIFRRQFLYLNLLFSWQETVENYLHRPENSYLKKKVNRTKVRKVIAEYYNLCHDFSNRL